MDDLDSKIRKEISEARREALEQARLNGMGSEREAKLMAQVEKLRGEAYEANWCLQHINQRVCPGSVDSIDAMKSIIKEHAEMASRFYQLQNQNQELTVLADRYKEALVKISRLNFAGPATEDRREATRNIAHDAIALELKEKADRVMSWI